MHTGRAAEPARAWGPSRSLSSPVANYALSAASWPFQPAQTYYVLATNTSASPQAFVLRLDGRNAATEDEDGDGLPDQWEYAHFGGLYQYSGGSDPDGDGLSNWQEYLLGTNPTDPHTRGSLASPAALPGGGFAFDFLGETNGLYRVQVSTNLREWGDLLLFTNFSGATHVVAPGATNSDLRYYRTVTP